MQAAQAHVDAAIELLGTETIEGSYGVRIGDGFGRNWGNAIMGLRNAIAPPLHIETDGVSRSWVDFELGAAYEGPPTFVHGGVLSLVLDHVFGAAAGADQTPAHDGHVDARLLAPDPARRTPAGRGVGRPHRGPQDVRGRLRRRRGGEDGRG